VDEKADSDKHEIAMLPSYPQIGERAFGNRGKRLIKLSILVQQLSVCTVYFSFMSDNIVKSIPSDTSTPLGDPRLIMTIILPLVVLLTSLPNLKMLAPLSAFASALLLACFIMLAVCGVINGDASTTNDDDALTTAGYSLSEKVIATTAILYSFEGICLVLPVSASLSLSAKSREKSTYIIALTVVTLTFLTFSLGALYAFGKVTDGSITAYLIEREGLFPNGGWLIAGANVTSCISVLCTYPLQLYPCLELGDEGDGGVVDVYEPVGQNDEESRLVAAGGASCNEANWRRRIKYILLTYALAMIVPDVGLMISLAGSVAGTSAALIIPPVLELQLNGLESSSYRRIWLLGIVVLGVVLAGIGAVTALIKIFQNFE